MKDEDLTAALRGLRDPAPDDLLARTLADAALTAGRRVMPEPSQMLTARVLRDARTVARARRWRELAAWGSLAAACVIGIAVGFGDPGGYLAALGGADATDLAGGYGFQYADLSQ